MHLYSMKILFANLFVFLSVILSTSSVFASEKSLVIEESDFQQLSQEMKKKKVGLVLMLHAEFCPYCELMDSDILSPMIKSGEYVDKVLIRKLQVDEARDIKDFTGKVVEPSDMAAKYGSFVTPTLVFLDSQGNERAKQMVGINTVEFFGAYLDAEIDKLQKKIVSDVKTDVAEKSASMQQIQNKKNGSN